MPGPDGKGVMHAELLIGNSIIMMGEENPHEPCKSAVSLGGSPVSFYIYVDSVDEAFQRALDAGGESRMPLQDMFLGGPGRDLAGPLWVQLDDRYSHKGPYGRGNPGGCPGRIRPDGKERGMKAGGIFGQ